VLCRSVICESINNLFWPTQISPFLILSIFRAVRYFYSVYFNIVLIHIWGYKQPQEIQGKIPENDYDILRYMFACIQIVNVMICLHAICTVLLNHFYTTLPIVILHHNCTSMHNWPVLCFSCFFGGGGVRILPWLILIKKANQMHYFSTLFWLNSTCFGQIFCPSSGVLLLYSQQ